MTVPRKSYVVIHYYADGQAKEAIHDYKKRVGKSTIAAQLKGAHAVCKWTVKMASENYQYCYWHASSPEAIMEQIKPLMHFWSGISIKESSGMIHW